MLSYDEIVSLGYNCEVSFRIEDYFGTINAMPFSWSYILNREKFPEVLRQPDKIMSKEISILDDHMIKCSETDIKFHPRYSILPQYGSFTDKQFQEAIKELKERVYHLVAKYKELCNSDKHTLFVMKVEDYGDEQNVTFINEIKKALDEVYVSGNYKLAIAMIENGITENIRFLESEKLKVYPFKKFSNKKRTNISGDMKSWYSLFKNETNVSSDCFYKNVWKRRVHWLSETFLRKLGIK